MFVVVARGGFRAAEMNAETRQGRGVLVVRVGADRLLVGEVFNAQSRDLRSATAAGSEGREEQCPVAEVDQPIASTGLQQL